MSDQKKIFISYSWDSPEHQNWVKKFSDDLQARLGDSFEVLLDQNQRRGTSLSRFMKRGLKDAVKVLIIGTPKYKEKSEASCGVAYETMVITNEMMSNMDTTKFYPILRSGSFDTSFPTDIKDRIGDDFSDDNFYEKNLQTVIKEITTDNPIPDYFNQNSTDAKVIPSNKIEIAIIKSLRIRKLINEAISEINTNKALNLCVQCINLDPQYAVAYYIKALLELDLGRTLDAVKDIIFAKKLKHNVVEAFNARSLLTERLKELDNSINGVKYSDDMKTLIRVPSEKKDTFLIPNFVIDIGSHAFIRCSNLTSIVIPNSVTVIGRAAFLGCKKLTSIYIPSSATEIGDNAFEGCTNLYSIHIPSSVARIGSAVFMGCSELKSLDVDDGNTKYRSINDALFSKDMKLLIHVPKNVIMFCIPYSVTKIEEFAFKGCVSLISLEIPNGVTEIGQNAFEECCGLTSIKIPVSVTTIGKEAFKGCENLQSVSIPSSITEIEDETFFECKSLSKIEIPDSIITIGNSAFEGCSNLSSINIPTSVIKVGWRAFYGCSSLSSLVIPDSMTKIDEETFSCCSNLSSIILPKSVTSIMASAFSDCKSIKNFDVDKNNPSYCDKEGVLFSKDMTILMRVPHDRDNYSIPSSVNKIEGWAFDNCSDLTSVEIPNSVTEIGEWAFEYCSSLTSINIPISVTNIGDGAFFGCASIKSIEIPNSVTRIRERTFSSCKSLSSIVIPDSVKRIGEAAFVGCNISEIHLKNQEPVERSYPAIGLEKKRIILYVPKGSEDAYRDNSIYERFKDIIEE